MLLFLSIRHSFQDVAASSNDLASSYEETLLDGPAWMEDGYPEPEMLVESAVCQLHSIQGALQAAWNNKIMQG